MLDIIGDHHPSENGPSHLFTIMQEAANPAEAVARVDAWARATVSRRHPDHGCDLLRKAIGTGPAQLQMFFEAIESVRPLGVTWTSLTLALESFEQTPGGGRPPSL